MDASDAGGIEGRQRGLAAPAPWVGPHADETNRLAGSVPHDFRCDVDPQSAGLAWREAAEPPAPASVFRGTLVLYPPSAGDWPVAGVGDPEHDRIVPGPVPALLWSADEQTGPLLARAALEAQHCARGCLLDLAREVPRLDALRSNVSSKVNEHLLAYGRRASEARHQRKQRSQQHGPTREHSGALPTSQTGPRIGRSVSEWIGSLQARVPRGTRRAPGSPLHRRRRRCSR